MKLASRYAKCTFEPLIHSKIGAGLTEKEKNRFKINANLNGLGVGDLLISHLRELVPKLRNQGLLGLKLASQVGSKVVQALRL